MSGGASNPGLDGSNLALATGSIVVVMQYRLGVVSFLPLLCSGWQSWVSVILMPLCHHLRHDSSAGSLRRMGLFLLETSVSATQSRD